MWGSPEPKCTVYIDREAIVVRENLYDFFEWHWENLPDWLWIDQLCIDQRNMNERNHQVAMMGEIYKHAENVCIWLGANVQAASMMNNVLTHLASFENTVHSLGETRALIHALDADDSALDKELLSNSYWLRLWIVQEVLLARSRLVFWGSVTISWDTLKRIHNASVHPARTKGSYHCPAVTAFINIDFGQAADDLQHHIVDPVVALNEWAENSCEDRVDRYYGLQGLFEGRFRIEVDYVKPVDEVFLDALIVFQQNKEGRGQLIDQTLAACRALGLLDVPSPRDLYLHMIDGGRVRQHAEYQKLGRARRKHFLTFQDVWNQEVGSCY